MENNAPLQPPSSSTLPERIRNRLAGHALVNDVGAIQIIAATVQSRPELTFVSTGRVALGDDGLIRFALWSASKCCASLLGTRRATLLLAEGDDTWEIRCLVIANASLATARPFSGFLLKPIEVLDRRASCSARGPWRVRRSAEENQNGAGETRLALFEAFPVGDDGENVLPGGVHPP